MCDQFLDLSNVFFLFEYLKVVNELKKNKNHPNFVRVDIPTVLSLN